MSIPTYSLLSRRLLPQEYPPHADPPAEGRFQRQYEGDREVELRIRHAMYRYAAKQWRFWQFSVASAALGLVAFLVGFRHAGSWFGPFVALLVLVAMAIMPLRILSATRNVATLYAIPGEIYAASFDETGIVWKVSATQYRIAFDSISNVTLTDEIFILALRGSRAICILPVELLTDTGRARLSEVLSL